MIIQLSQSALNELAVQALLQERSQQVVKLNQLLTTSLTKDSIVTILDLDANGLVQNYLSPSTLARKLHKADLFKSVQTIQLLCSDIIPTRSLLGFATELSQAILRIDSTTRINIQVPHALADCLLIVPPNDLNNDWSGYSMPSSDVSKLNIPKEQDSLEQGNFEFYRSHINKIAFQGSITERLQIVANQIDAEATQKTFRR